MGYKTSIPGVFGGRWAHRAPLRGVSEFFLKTIESKPNKKSKKNYPKSLPEEWVPRGIIILLRRT